MNFHMRVQLDLVSHYFDTFVNLMGIIFNLVLLYAVWRHTPQKMRTCSVLISNTIIADLVIALCGILTSNRLIPSGTAVVFISNGPCIYLGSRFCLILHMTLIHAVEHGLMSQFISFSYRYYILVNTTIPTRLQLIVICLLVYTPTFILYIFRLGSFTDPAVLREMLVQYHPCYNFTKNYCPYARANHTLYGYYSYTEPLTLITILYLIVPNIPLYLLIAVLRRKTCRILKDTSTKLKKSSRRLHLSLMKVLTIQSYTPLFLIATMTMYIIGQLQLLNHPVLEYLSQTSISFIPLCNPIISLAYIKPYRNVIAKWFRPVTQHRSLRNFRFSKGDTSSTSLTK